MAGLKAITGAAEDEGLMKRFVAAAAAQGISNPEVWVYSRRYALATAIYEGEQTIADLYEFVDARRKTAEAVLPPLAHESDDILLDGRLVSAVSNVQFSEGTPSTFSTTSSDESAPVPEQSIVESGDDTDRVDG